MGLCEASVSSLMTWAWTLMCAYACVCVLVQTCSCRRPRPTCPPVAPQEPSQAGLRQRIRCLGAQRCSCPVAPSCLALCSPMDYSPSGSSVHVMSQAKKTGVGCHFLLQGIFQIQGLNLCILPCRWILHPLSHLESPNTLMYYWHIVGAQ